MFYAIINISLRKCYSRKESTKHWSSYTDTFIRKPCVLWSCNVVSITVASYYRKMRVTPSLKYYKNNSLTRRDSVWSFFNILIKVLHISFLKKHFCLLILLCEVTSEFPSYIQSSYLLGGLETWRMQLRLFIITDMLITVMLRTATLLQTVILLCLTYIITNKGKKYIIFSNTLHSV